MTVTFDTLDPRFARMRDHLAALCGDRRLPRRADLDPLAFADQLPYVNLIDVVLANDAVRFRFRLSESARVRIAIERALAGRRKGGRCVAPGKARRGAKRCSRWRRVTTLRKQAKSGPNSVRFSGKVRGRSLRVGRYRALATAKDAVGNSSRRPRKAGFSAVHVPR